MNNLQCPKCGKSSFKGPKTKFCQYCGADFAKTYDRITRVVLINDNNVTELFFAYVFDADNNLLTQYCGTTWTAPAYARSWRFEASSHDGMLSHNDIEEGCRDKSVIIPALKTLNWYKGTRPAKDEVFTDPSSMKQLTYGEILERNDIDEAYQLDKWQQRSEKRSVTP